MISHRHKDLCGLCYSGGEGKAAGKTCQREVTRQLGALQILIVLGCEDFQTLGKGHCGCMCGVLLLHLQLGFWRSDMPCFGAGPWRVARETIYQLHRCSQRRGERVTQVASSGMALPPHYMEKGLRHLFHLDPTEVTLLILPSWDRAVSPSPTSDWWELARLPWEGNDLRHPWPH